MSVRGLAQIVVINLLCLWLSMFLAISALNTRIVALEQATTDTEDAP